MMRRDSTRRIVWIPPRLVRRRKPEATAAETAAASTDETLVDGDTTNEPSSGDDLDDTGSGS